MDAPARFPPLWWLRGYQPRWLASDLVGGVTLAAYAVPVSLAYAGLAGLPPQVGLYGYLLGGLGYAIFGSSRHLAVGPTSAISLMVGGTVAQMAGGDMLRYGQIAALAGLVVGVLSLIAWALRLSALTSFISETILLGFKAGAGLSIASTQLAGFLGVKGGGDDFFTRVWTVMTQLGSITPVVALFGLAALAALVLGEKLLPGRPIALFVVVASILVVSTTSLSQRGLVTVGEIPAGLPKFGLPGVRVRDVDGLVPLALGCLLLAYIEGVSAARAFAEKHDYPIDARQELLGLAAANFAVAFGGGYPVAGGLSQSAVNEKAGAKTPLALVFASATLAICLLFLTGLVAHLPKAVLAAIVLVAVTGLIQVEALKHIWRFSRQEFAVAVVALFGVLGSGLLNGVLFGVVISIVLLLGRASRPRVVEIGRVPGTSYFADLVRHPENERVPDVLVVRLEGALLYFNTDHVRDRLAALVSRREAPPRLIVLFMGTSPFIDLAGTEMLIELHAAFRGKGIAFRLAEAHGQVREALHRVGHEESAGLAETHATVDDVVNAWRAAPGRGLAAAS